MFEKEIGSIMDANDEKEIPAEVKPTVDAYDRIIKALEYEVIDTAKAIMQYRKLLESIKEEGTEEEIEMKAVYFDTGNLCMCRKGFAFRIRYENGIL